MLKPISVLLACVLVGCAVNYEAPNSDLSTSDAKTILAVPADSISRNSPYREISRVEFVVLRTYGSNNPAGYREFMKNSLLSMGFKKVLDDAEFARLIIDKDAAPQVPEASDLVGLNRLVPKLGPYLIIESALYLRSSAYWRSILKIVDPETPAILLEYDYSKYTVGSINELTYPSVNLIRAWYQSSR